MENSQDKPIDVLKVAWSRKWELTIFSLVFTAAAFVACSLLPKDYESEATVFISPPKFTSTGNEKMPDFLSIGSYRDLVFTSGFLQKIIDQLKLAHPNSLENFYPETLKNMIKIETPVSAISVVNKSELMTFRVKGQDSSVITEIANLLTTTLTEESLKMRANEVATIANYTRAQYTSISEALFKKEKALETLMIENPFPNAKKDDDRQFKYIGDDAAEVKRGLLKIYEVERSQVRLELSAAQGKAASLKLQAKNNSVLTNEKLLNAKIPLDSLISQEKFLNKIILSLEKEILSLNRIRLIKEQREREINALKTSYQNVSARLQNIQSHESEKTSDIRLISKAIEPKIPVWPNTVNIVLIAFAISIAAGMAIALAKEHLDNVTEP